MPSFVTSGRQRERLPLGGKYVLLSLSLSLSLSFTIPALSCCYQEKGAEVSLSAPPHEKLPALLFE